MSSQSQWIRKTIATSKAVTLLSMMVSVGCAASDVANRYYGTKRFAPKDPKDVQLLDKRPTREFTVIADFQSRGEGPEDMRRRAAEIGAEDSNDGFRFCRLTMSGGLTSAE